MQRAFTVAAALAAAAWASPAPAQSEYMYDDGTGDLALNYGLPGDYCWMNWFQTRPEFDQITAIRIAFGGLPDGYAFTAHVWNDASGGGDPFAAVLLSSRAGFVQGGDTSEFVLVDVPDVRVGRGFFVGVIIHNDPDASPALFDRSFPHARSSWFIFADRIRPNDLFADGGYPYRIEEVYPPGGDFMIRADAIRICPVDFNRDGRVDSDDFFDFLNAYYEGQLSADFNGDGLVDSDDFFDFLNAFYAGC